MTIDLIGYTNRLSARPGETLDFKVSCKHNLCNGAVVPFDFG